METMVMSKNQILDYLLNTQVELEKVPDYPLREELDTLIELMMSGQPYEDYLRSIAEKESQLIASGIIPDEDGDGVGFFGSLLELVGLGLEGLGKINWQSIRSRLSKLTQKINRVNPITVSARNALRILISINIFGYATAISKSAEVKAKVINLYKRLGGKPENILRAINTGAKKKPVFARKGTVHGLAGANIQTLLRQAGSFINQIKVWIDQALRQEKERQREREKQAKLNAIIELMKMNIYGYASVIARNSSLKAKVLNLFRQLGGNTRSLEQAILIGSRKPPVHNTSTPISRPPIIDRRHPGIPPRFHGLGEPLTIGGMLTLAGEFLLKIKNWIKQAGIKINVNPSGNHHTADVKTKTTDKTPSKTPAPTPAYPPAQAQMPSAPRPDLPSEPAPVKAGVNVGGSNKGLKIFLGLTVAGATAFGLYKFTHKPKKDSLKGITLK